MDAERLRGPMQKITNFLLKSIYAEKELGKNQTTKDFFVV
jgi:hypothetical protein